MPNIKLQSSDKEIFEVDVEIAKASVTIKTMLDDLGMSEEEEIVPLPVVNSTILKKIIAWATYHKDDPVPADEDDLKDKRHQQLGILTFSRMTKEHFSNLFLQLITLISKVFLI